MNGQATLQQWYYRGRVRALVTCFAGWCAVDVRLQDEQAASAVRLEIVLQPRAPNGLPQGHARCLFETAVPLRRAVGGRSVIGSVRLPPHLQADLLRHCHLRVTPHIMEAPSDNSRR